MTTYRSKHLAIAAAAALAKASNEPYVVFGGGKLWNVYPVRGRVARPEWIEVYPNGDVLEPVERDEAKR